MTVRPKTKRRLLILLAAALFVTVGLAAVYVVRMQRLRAYYLGLREQGIAQHKAGDYENAQVNLSRYLRRDEYARDADALYYFADASRHVERPNYGHVVLAASQLKRAVELRPERDDWRRQLLQDYLTIGYNSETIATADALLKSNPADAQAHRARAAALAALRRPTDALDAAKLCLKSDPHDLRTHLLLLELYRDPRNLNAARDDDANRDVADKQSITPADTILRRARDLLAANPGDGRYLLLMSAACLLAQEPTPAMRDELLRTMRTYDDKAADPSPVAASVFFARTAVATTDLSANAEHVELLLNQLQRLGMAGEAMEVAQKAEPLKLPRVREFLVRRLFETERYADVQQRLADVQLNPAAPADAELLGIKAASLVKLGRRDDAAPIIAALRAATDSRLAQAWATIVEQFYFATQPDLIKATDALHSAIKHHPGDPYLHYFLGDVAQRQGETDQAAASFRRAIQYAPLWAQPFIRFSQVRLQEGNTGEALGAAQAATRVAPHSLLTHVNLALAWAASIDDKDWARATDLLQLVSEIQRLSPGEQQTLPVYVQALAMTGSRPEAERIARAAIRAEKPLAEQTLLRLAAVSKRVGLGLEDDALAASERAHGLTPDLALARALDLLAGGRRDEALRFLDEGRRDKPKADELPWRLAWARFLEHVKDPRAAAEWAALASDPAYAADLNVQRAVIAAPSVQGDRELLAKTVERLRKLTGDNAPAWRIARARLLLADPAAAPADATDEAIRLLKEAVATSPADVSARMLLALAYQRRGEHDAADDHLREALNVEPQSVNARLALAASFQSRSQFEQAQQHLALIPADKLDVPQRQRLALLHRQQGQLAEATRLMKQIPPDKLDPAGAVFLAELTWRGGDVPRAQSLFEDLRARPGLSPDDQLRLAAAHAGFLAATGRSAEADAALASTAALQVPPVRRDLTLAAHYAQRGDRAKAIEHYRAAIALQPADEQTWTALVEQLVRAGRIDDALAAADESAKFLPKAPTLGRFRTHAPLLKAIAPERRYAPLIALMLQDNAAAADSAAQALRISAEGARSLEARAAGAAEIRKLADENPRSVALLILLAQEHELLGQRKEAAAVAQRAAQVAPASPEVAQVAAQALAAAAQDRSERRHALVAAQRWRELSAGDALAADLFITQLHLQSDDPTAALRQLAPYLPLAAANPDAYAPVLEFQSRALVAAGRPDEAADLLWPLTAKAPVWRQVWMRRAVSLSKTPEAAAAWLQRVQPIIPPDATDERIALATAWFELGVITQTPAHRQRARHLLDQLVQQHPDNAAVVSARGVILEQDNDLAGAERDYRATLSIEPRHGIAANNLAMVLARRGGDALPEALALAKRAVEAFPRAPTIHDTLAFVQAKSKDYSAALASLQTAVRLEPANPLWRLHLAEVQLEAGRKEEAARQLRDIESLFPTFPRDNADAATRFNDLRSSLSATR